MSRFRVYIKPFDDDGNYQSDYIEVTDDVSSKGLGNIKEALDTNDFDVGIFKFNSIALNLNNQSGRYSDINQPKTVFRYKRNNTLARITWETSDLVYYLGFAELGTATFAEEYTVFDGLLNDDNLTQNMNDQNINFTILGLEAIVNQVETNNTSLSIGQSISDAIYTVLNQTAITKILTVSPGNISVGTNQTLDDVSEFADKNVKETLDELLLASNSVLYIDNATVYVSPRTPSASVEYIFYGQASSDGNENIADLRDVKNGLNKTFNVLKWTDSTEISKNTSSIALNGFRVKEIEAPSITNTSKRDSILDNYRDEFGSPKREMQLKTPINQDVIQLKLLDRVAIDYPTVFKSAEGGSLPLYSKAVYGTDLYPFGEWQLQFNTSDNWKIMNRSVDVKDQNITFKLREI